MTPLETAARAALAADVAADASPARISPFRPGPVIQVAYLADSFPGLGATKTMFAPGLMQAMREILHDLRLDPHQLRAREFQPGDAMAGSEGRGELERPVVVLATKRGDDVLPLVTVWTAMTAGEANAALQRLHVEGWFPLLDTFEPGCAAAEASPDLRRRANAA